MTGTAYPNQYPDFQPNQALSHTHLNSLTDFFLGQDLLTRARLVGTGILCGFELSRDGDSISLSKGVGVTSAGYLLNSEQAMTFRFIKTFVDKAEYFKSKPNLLEELLVSEPMDDPDVRPLSAADLEGKVAFLFLEKASISNDKCENNCIDRGKTRAMNQHLILLDKADARREFWLRSGSKGPEPDENMFRRKLLGRFEVDDFHMPRPLLTPENSGNWVSIMARYEDVCTRATNALILAMSEAFYAFGAQLNKDFNGDALIKQFSEKQAEALKRAKNQKGIHLQTLFDWLSHLGLAYNAWIEAAFEVTGSCCPTLDDYPCHLMLDDAFSQSTPALYRHHFRPSPIHAGGHGALSNAQLYLKRLEGLIVGFGLPVINTGSLPMRLSPGSCSQTLDQRPIPWYVPYRNLSPLWSAHNSRWKRNLHANGYGAYDLAENEGSHHQLSPFSFTIEDQTYYRLEGHIGLDVSTVLNNLEAERHRNNLAFEVVCVEPGDLDQNLEKFCGFEDLFLLYRLTREELLCSFQELGEYLAGLGTFKPDSPPIRVPGKRVYLSQTMKNLREEGTDVADFSRYAPFAQFVGAPVNAAVLTGSEKGLTAEPLAAVGRGAILFSGLGETPTFKSGDLAVIRGERKAFNEVVYYIKDVVDEKGVKTDLGLAFPPHKPQPIDKFSPKEANLMTANLIGRLLELEGLLPDKLMDFNQQDFSDQKTRVIARARLLREGILKLLKDPDYTPKGFENELITQLGDLIENCVFARLEELIQALQERMVNEDKANTFGNFLQQHPGLEHKSGVCQGGTLVLVCASDIQLLPPADPTRPAFEKASGSGIEAAKLVDAFQSYQKNQDPLQDKIMAASRVGIEAAINPNARLAVPTTEPSPNKLTLNPENLNRFFNDFAKIIDGKITGRKRIVADFCLPYSCCGSCHSQSYLILPEPMIRLGKDAFCRDDQKTYAFELVPPGGIVRGAGVSPDGAGGFVFMPAAADVISGDVAFIYERDIRRAVLIVEVQDPLEPDFTWQTLEWNDQTTTIRFTAQVPRATSYEWDFGDNNPVSGEELIYTFSNFIEGYEVTLTAANKACSASITKTIDSAIAEMDIERTIFCGNDPIGYEISVQPEGGQVIGPDNSVVKSDDEKWYFYPGQVILDGADRPIQLEYEMNGGVIDTLELKVLKPPVVSDLSFEANDLGDQWEVNLTAKVEGDIQILNWSFGDGVTEETQEPEAVHHYLEPGSYEVILTAVRQTGEDVSCQGSQSVKLVLIRQETLIFDMQDPFREFCWTDQAGYNLITNPADGVVISDPPNIAVKEGLQWKVKPSRVPVPPVEGDAVAIQLFYQQGGQESNTIPIKVVRPAGAAFTVSGKTWDLLKNVMNISFQNLGAGKADLYRWTFLNQSTGVLSTLDTTSREPFQRSFAPGTWQFQITAIIQLDQGRICQSTSAPLVEIIQNPLLQNPVTLLANRLKASIKELAILDQTINEKQAQTPDRDYWGQTKNQIGAMREQQDMIYQLFNQDPDAMLAGKQNSVLAEVSFGLVPPILEILAMVHKQAQALGIMNPVGAKTELLFALDLWRIFQIPLLTLLNVAHLSEFDSERDAELEKVLGFYLETGQQLNTLEYFGQNGIFQPAKDLVTLIEAILGNPQKPNLHLMVKKFWSNFLQ